mgnify:CR=1 FL=1
MVSFTGVLESCLSGCMDGIAKSKITKIHINVSHHCHSWDLKDLLYGSCHCMSLRFFHWNISSSISYQSCPCVVSYHLHQSYNHHLATCQRKTPASDSPATKNCTRMTTNDQTIILTNINWKTICESGKKTEWAD